MRKRFRLLASFIALASSSAAFAQTQPYAVITASQIGDGSGSGGLLQSGTLCATPADAHAAPLNFAAGGGGNKTIAPVCAYVVDGAITSNVAGGTFQLANTGVTVPANLCWNIVVTDSSSGNAVLGGPASQAYTCVQMNSSWCSVVGSTYTCNFDSYTPNTPAQAPVQLGVRARGVWSSGATYSLNDLVTFTTASGFTNTYISLAGGNSGNEPDTSTSYWSLFAQQGALPNLAAGNVTTCAVGSSPTAALRLNQQSNGYLIDLCLPQGNPGGLGPTGAQGPTGPAGPAGPVGMTLAIGSVTQGLTGSTASATINADPVVSGQYDLNITIPTAPAGTDSNAVHTNIATAQKMSGPLQVAGLARKAPIVDVTHPDFGYGQPIQSVTVSNGYCTSAPTITFPPPTYSQDGSTAQGAGYCVNGQARFDITFPGGGYTSSQTPTITGGGTSGATASLNLLGTAGTADPTGVADSCAAIENAVDYSVSLAATFHGYPAVRLPAGQYKCASGVRVPDVVDFGGDAMAASRINAGAGSEDVIAFYHCTACTQYALGENTGGIHALTINGPGHTHTGTMLALYGSTVGNIFRDLILQNSGGVAIHITGAAERHDFQNIDISDVRWPIVGAGNETHFRKLLIYGPGYGDSGYQYGPNTASGVSTGYVGGEFTGGTLSALTCDGSGNCTLTETGHNGISPIPVGGWFQVSGVSDLSAANGVFKATAVANNTPAAGEFQVTYAVVSSANTVSPFYYDAGANIQVRSPVMATPSGTSSGLSGAEFTIAFWPVPYAAVQPDGENVRFQDGSIKPVANAGAIQGWQWGVGSFDGFYVEAAQPSLNAAFTNGGWVPFSSLSGSLSSTATCSLTSFCTVADTEDPTRNWFPNYATSFQYIDLQSVDYPMEIMPQDYNPSSSSPSAYVTGVNQNQYEVVDAAFGADGNLYIGARLQALGSHHISTAVAWPAGSLLGFVNEAGTTGPNGESHVELADNHLNSEYPLPSGWTAECNDNGPNICGSAILGVTPDYVVTYPVGTSGQATIGGGVFLNGYQLEGYCTDTNSIGSECIKVQGGGLVASGGGGSGLTYGAAPSAVANGVTQGSSGSYYITKAGVIPVHYAGTGYYSSVVVRDTDSGAAVFVPASATSNGGWVESTLMGSANEAVIPSPSPGFGMIVGHQFSTSDCWYDTPSPTQNTVNDRFCFKGGPNLTGTSSGFEYDVYNGTSWVNGFNFAPDSSGNVDAFVQGYLNAKGGLRINLGTIYTAGMGGSSDINLMGCSSTSIANSHAVVGDGQGGCADAGYAPNLSGQVNVLAEHSNVNGLLWYRGTATIYTAGAGMGSGATASCPGSNCYNGSGLYQVTLGSSPAAGAVLNLTFGSAPLYQGAKCGVSPSNAAAATAGLYIYTGAGGATADEVVSSVNVPTGTLLFYVSCSE